MELTRRALLRRGIEAGLALGLLGVLGHGLYALNRPYARGLLASAVELRGLLADGDAGIRVLDARPLLQYRRGHLPGAANVWDGDLNVWTDVPRRLAPAPQLAEVLGRAGVSRERPVVVYDGGEGVWAARLLWALRYLGHPDVRLLDGGLAAWRAAGGALTTEPPRVEPTTFEPRVRPELLVEFDELRAALEAEADVDVDADDKPAPLVPVDARTPREYAEGHLPGALPLPADALLRRDGRFRPAWLLKVEAERAGVPLDPARKAVVYSNTGLRAALAYVGLSLLGLDVALYDGGLAEWKARGAPLVRVRAAPAGAGVVEEHRSTCW